MATKQTNANEVIAQAIAEATRAKMQAMAVARAEITQKCRTQARWTHHEATDI